MKKKVNEVELSMDADTLNKVRGKLKPTDKISLTDKPSTSTPTTSTLPTSSVMEEDIEPQDQATIKYLSNVKDDKGDVSKPFTIDGKNYQMVRGITPSKEVVMAVYCHDDVNGDGENIIHPIEYFETNIANPAKIKTPEELPVTEKSEVIEPKKVNSDSPNQEKSLKLGEFKHFIIDKKSGKVRKFKQVEELAKAGMGDNEAYMNLSQFKKHVDETLFGIKKKKDALSEDDTIPNKPDVQMAIQQMVAKMKPYMDKINEPLEKIQFIVTLTKMLQLDSSKYPTLMGALKKAGNSTFGGQNSSTDTTQSTQTTQVSQTGIAENKVITKNDLINSIKTVNVIKTIKIKDIK
jgi:hypothetical protein